MNGAIFSSCGQYRYALWRAVNPARTDSVLFIGLNPSTADAVHDDPTVRRCKAFAQRWGYGYVCVANLFAWRATHPAQLRASPWPVGSENDDWLVRLAAEADLVIAAWGVQGAWGGRDREVVKRIDKELFCLGVTQGGQPRHPLYLKATAVPRVWMPNI